MNQCPYCKKNIAPGTSFCIHCGRDLRKTKQEIVVQKPVEQQPVQKSEPVLREEASTGKTTKKLTVFFNAFILLTATCCIFGFIYFTVQNKMESTADKSDEHAEIIDNLYRNKKYKFRIKFPEGWKIQTGDGPNVLIKASSENGNSVNLVVKDMGVPLGDIDDLFTLDEWAESIHEKFPAAKLLEKKGTHLDNRKAFYVKYEVDYEAMDMKVKMIMFNVALINGNFLYVITASSEYNSFAENENVLNQSVRTFVIEN